MSLFDQLAAHFPTRGRHVAAQPRAPEKIPSGEGMARLQHAHTENIKELASDHWLVSPEAPGTITCSQTFLIGTPAEEDSGAIRTHSAAVRILHDWALPLVVPQYAVPVGLPHFAKVLPGYSVQLTQHEKCWALDLIQSRPDEAIFGIRTTMSVFTEQAKSGNYETRLSITVSTRGTAEHVRVPILPVCYQVEKELGFYDIFGAVTSRAMVVTGDNVDSFISYLESKDRYLAVLVIGRGPVGWRLDPYELALQSLGLGRVVLINDDAITRMIEVLGLHQTPLAGSLKLYTAGFHRQQKTSWHPMLKKERLQSWQMAGKDIQSHLRQMVQDHAARSKFARPFVPIAGSYVPPGKKETAQEIFAAEPQQEELNAEQTAAKIADMEAQLSMLKAQIKQLTIEQQVLVATGQDRLARRAALPVGIPETLEGLEQWVSTALSGKLVLHAKAKASLAKAVYDDSDRVYEALCFLAFEYRNCCQPRTAKRAGEPTASRKAEDRLAALHMKESRSISDGQPTSADYYVDYGGSRVMLDRHLAHGVSRDPRRCLRVYFFYDAEEDLVVVGHLPNHLPTTMS